MDTTDTINARSQAGLPEQTDAWRIAGARDMVGCQPAGLGTGGCVLSWPLGQAGAESAPQQC